MSSGVISVDEQNDEESAVDVKIFLRMTDEQVFS